MPHIDIDDGLDNIRDLGKDGNGRDTEFDEDDDDESSGTDDEIQIVVGDDNPDIDFADGDPDEHDNDSPDEDEAPQDEAPPKDAKKKEHEGDGDDDLEGFSEKIRKRIQRERRLKEEERKKRIEIEARLEQLEAERDSATVGSRLDKAIEELEDARRDADTRKEAEAQAKVSRLIDERDRLEERKQKRAADNDDGGDQSDQKKAPPNPAYKRWLDRNRWFDAPEHAMKRRMAIAIAGGLIEDEGLKDDSPELYERLDEEIKKLGAAPRRRDPPPRTTIQRDTDADRVRSKRKVVITERDKTLMRRMQLDPSNKAHLRAYAEEKLNG